MIAKRPASKSGVHKVARRAPKQRAPKTKFKFDATKCTIGRIGPEYILRHTTHVDTVADALLLQPLFSSLDRDIVGVLRKAVVLSHECGMVAVEAANSRKAASQLRAAREAIEALDNFVRRPRFERALSVALAVALSEFRKADDRVAFEKTDCLSRNLSPDHISQIRKVVVAASQRRIKWLSENVREPYVYGVTAFLVEQWLKLTKHRPAQRDTRKCSRSLASLFYDFLDGAMNDLELASHIGTANYYVRKLNDQKIAVAKSRKK